MLRYFWLIDPIDGTKDYVNNKDEFTLNASLIIGLKPAIGIIYAPAKKRLFYSFFNKLNLGLKNYPLKLATISDRDYIRENRKFLDLSGKK